MKKRMVFSIYAVFLATATFLFAGGPRTGSGRDITATTTPSIVTNLNLRYVSLLNQGSEDVFVLVNTSTNQMRIASTNGTAIRIPAGLTFDFVSIDSSSKIKSVATITTNGTTTVLWAGF